MNIHNGEDEERRRDEEQFSENHPALIERGHKLLECEHVVNPDGKRETVYLTKRNDVYVNGEVERWYVFVTGGHHRNGCNEKTVRWQFQNYVNKFKAGLWE